MTARRIGVVGAGQLGLMLDQAASDPSLGIDLRVLAERADDPATTSAPDRWLAGAATSERDLRALAGLCDVITVEHELVSLDALRRIEAEGTAVRPGPSALAAIVDKVAMRRAVRAAGLPEPPWCQVNGRDQLDDALGRWPRAAVKLARGGYDGRGVHLVDSPDEGRRVGLALLDQGAVLLLEPRLDIELEVAVIACRRPGGAVVVYDPVRTLQVDGQCREVRMPAGISAAMHQEALDIAVRAAHALDVVGLLAVELFVVDGRFVVNELAARPHNTGHHTIEACVTSQFAQHLLAVADLPLRSTAATSAAAVMVNVIARSADSDPRNNEPAARALDPDAHVHLYGKAPRAERKVGHVTVLDDDLDRAAARAWAVVAALGGSLAGSPTAVGA